MSYLSPTKGVIKVVYDIRFNDLGLLYSPHVKRDTLSTQIISIYYIFPLMKKQNLKFVSNKMVLEKVFLHMILFVFSKKVK